MTIGRQKLSEYDKRIERAKYLAAEYSFAAKPLKFYVQITQFQQGLFATLVKEWGEAAVTPTGGAFRAELNLAILLPQYSSFLALVEAHAPKPLGAAATGVAREGSAAWVELLTNYWRDGGRADENGMSRSDSGRPVLREFLARGPPRVTRGLAGTDNQNHGIAMLADDPGVRQLQHRRRIDQDVIEFASRSANDLSQPGRVEQVRRVRYGWPARHEA